MRARPALALLAFLLLLPASVAEEPEDAPALWTEQYGGDLVAAVEYSPAVVEAGELPAVSIRFVPGHEVTEVSGQYCRIDSLDPLEGPTCFRAGLVSTVSTDGNTFIIDLAGQGDSPAPIPLPVAGERLGTQFFIARGGETLQFPQGLPQDHPWFFGTEEEFRKWDETQYFAFNVQAPATPPLDMATVGWIVIPPLVGIGVVVMFRQPVGLNLLLVAALLVPGAVTLWDQASDAAKAPDFTLTDTGWEGGIDRGPQEFSLSDFEGKTVVIDFMAYNCAACRIVTEHVMEPLWADYGHRDDFVILTIDVGEFTNFPGSTKENLIRWQTIEFDSPWVHALDTERVFLDYVDFGAVGLPSVFVLDGERNIILQDNGVSNREAMSAVIEASFTGEAEQVDVLTIGVVGLALVAGIASFFAPCSVGLIPAYMGFLLQRQQKEGIATLPAGLATAAGIVSLYGVLALLLWLVSDALSGVLPFLGPIMGGLLVVLGVLMLIGFDWERVAKRLGMGKVDGRHGFFAFGVGYGLAAFGCTGPIFLPILVAGFAQGATIGFLAFAVYALAVASLVVLAAYLVGAGRQTRLRAILSHTKLITRISAVLLIAAGAYLVWFDVSAFA